MLIALPSHHMTSQTGSAFAKTPVIRPDIVKNRAVSLALFFVCAFAACILQTPAYARASLPSIFSDGMVLQREQPINIWGKSAPSEKLDISLGGQTRHAVADASGNWSVTFAALKPGSDIDLYVHATNDIHVKSIKVGDVYLCSGQSNMCLPINQTDFHDEDVAAPERANVRIYVAPAPTGTSSTDLADPHGYWMPLNDRSVRTLPAVPYLFGRQLGRLENIPVGVVSACCCGSNLETFLPPETIKREHVQPSALVPQQALGNNFRALLAPFSRFKFAGLLWYQGESNMLNSAKYRTLFPNFITDLRKRMEAPNLPVFFVQLPSFGWKQEAIVDSYWADMREAQAAATTLAGVYMVVSIDTDPDGPSLHPKEKREIAHRLANLAYQKNKGIAIERLPSVAKLETDGDTITVSFNIPHGHLRTSDGSNPRGFQIAGIDKHYHWADATLSGNSVKLTSDDVNAPVAVRYAYSDCPDCNLLYSQMHDQMPMPPFRTDSWLTSPKLNPAARPSSLASQ
jgi:sialate O-acetylesterase